MIYDHSTQWPNDPVRKYGVNACLGKQRPQHGDQWAGRGPSASRVASLYCRRSRRPRVLHKFNAVRSGALRPASRAIIWRLEKPTYGLQTRFNTTRSLIRFSTDIESSSISRRLRRRSGRQFGMILTIIDRHLVGFRSRSIDIVDGNRRQIANRSNWEDHACLGWRKPALPQPSP